MMNLLFDLTASQPNDSGKRHGGGKYCEMLFLAMCSKRLNFKAFFDSSKYISPDILLSAQKANIQLFDIKKQTLQEIVSSKKITHLYSALPEQILPWPSCKILGTIHGLRSFEMPFDFFAFWQFDKGLIGVNTFLRFLNRKKETEAFRQHYQQILQSKNFSFITVSYHSKQIIQSVTPHLSIPVFYPPSTIISKTLTRKIQSYFLLVSANRIEKNCVRAIIAIDKLYNNHKISKKIKVKIEDVNFFL